jgi:hypothetical protein
LPLSLRISGTSPANSQVNFPASPIFKAIRLFTFFAFPIVPVFLVGDTCDEAGHCRFVRAFAARLGGDLLQRFTSRLVLLVACHRHPLLCGTGVRFLRSAG